MTDLLDVALQPDRIHYRLARGVRRVRGCADTNCEDGRVCPDCRTFRKHERERDRGRTRYDRDRSRSRQRQWRYRLSPEEYERRLLEQDGKCAICGEAKKLAVDHDHATEEARGLLCWRCNSWLAGIETTDFVDRARAYLARWDKR